MEAMGNPLNVAHCWVERDICLPNPSPSDTIHSPAQSGCTRTVRNALKDLRRKLGGDADNPTYNCKEPRLGCRIPKGETQGREETGTGH